MAEGRYSGTGWIRVKLTGGIRKETQLIITNMVEEQDELGLN
jgi:hypothetical protein